MEETPEVVEAIKQLHISSVNAKLNKPHPYKNGTLTLEDYEQARPFGKSTGMS